MNTFTFITFLLPFIYTVVAIIKEKHAVSLRCFFFVFTLFFYSIAGFSQFYTPILPTYTVSEETFAQINIILLLCYIIFDVIYFYYLKNKKYDNCNNFKNNLSLRNNVAFGLICLSILCGLVVFYNNGFNFRNLLFRGGDEYVDRVDYSEYGNISLLFNVVRNMISVITFFIIVYSKQKFFKVVSILQLLLFFSPTAVARYAVAAAYIPILIGMFPKMIVKRNIIKLGMLGGMLVGFPLLNIFRFVDIAAAAEKFEFFDTSMFSTFHFDSYISLAFVYENEIVTNGNQLLGTIFFWFPRMFWENKPIGSGAFVAQTTDILFSLGEFSNIAMNFLGEGYINFGVTGIFAFIIVFALFAKKIDWYFWEKYNGDIYNKFAPFYLYTLGMFTFVMRGDLMSGIAFFASFMFAILFVSGIIKMFNGEMAK